LQNPDSFDPLKLARYTVIRAHYEFQNERPKSKLFIVLRHIVDRAGNFCWCIKPTSQTTRYEASNDLMKGTVIYEGGILSFFPEKTVIDPGGNLMKILHSHLQKEAAKNRYKIEGIMPTDFHDKLISAIENSILLEPKKMKELLAYLGVSPSSIAI
jgi:hypothetical protein